MADYLPPNATQQEVAIAETIARISDVPPIIRELWNADDIDASLLPWLAWCFSVDRWSASWTETQKRDAIKASVEVHRRKGTYGAVKENVDSVGYYSEVEENTGVPYTFRVRVDVSESVDNDATIAEVEKLALDAKNVRSHLVGVDMLLRPQGNIYLGAAQISGDEAWLYPEIIDEQTAQQGLFFGCCEQSVETTNIYAIT